MMGDTVVTNGNIKDLFSHLVDQMIQYLPDTWILKIPIRYGSYGLSAGIVPEITHLLNKERTFTMAGVY